jgi:membrane protein
MIVMVRDGSQRQPDAEAGAAAPPAADGPEPQPELDEPRLADPQLGDLSKRDYGAITVRAMKSALAGNVTNLAAAVAYNAFLAIPSALLVAFGAFSLLAGPSAIHTIMSHLSTVMPKSAVTLLGQSLTRATQARGGGLIMILVGVVLALWSLSGAMQTVMWATNLAYQRDETRNFVKKRLIALVMIICSVVSFVLVFCLLILGPHMTTWVGAAVGNTTAVTWVWWIAQWPILIIGLSMTFAITLYLAPNVVPPTWKLITPGAVFALIVWLLASAAFAFYTSQFASYNKAWGSLAAVIIMLIWLWLSALALLLGAEINAETERSRQLRQRRPAQRRVGRSEEFSSPERHPRPESPRRV